MVSVLFVCLGNICRSPTAEGVFRAVCEQHGLSGKIRIDSAGTAAWHVGKAPDERAIAAAKRRGIDLTALRARQVVTSDFSDFDFILAMDQANMNDLERCQPEGCRCQLRKILTYTHTKIAQDVPDPYYGGDQGFEEVLDLLFDAATGLMTEVKTHL